MDRTFFGLEPKDRLEIHQLIFDMIWWGAGRWDWNTIYNMPIFLRTFWIKQLNEKLTPPEPKPAEKPKNQDKVTRPPQFATKPKT